MSTQRSRYDWIPWFAWYPVHLGEHATALTCRRCWPPLAAFVAWLSRWRWRTTIRYREDYYNECFVELDDLPADHKRV